jgi:hypothetical protein
MALAIVNYPTLSDDDFEWIQSVRRKHDELYFDVIDPHFPFVFPTDDISESTLIDHARLYTGPQADELRLDLPLLLHVGIANAPIPEACKTIVDDLNAEKFEVRGRVTTVIGDDGETVWTIERARRPAETQ